MKLEFKNGNQYEIAFLDTNVISDIIKNKCNIFRNILLEYIKNGYGFATSVYTIIELNRTLPDFKEQFEKFFSGIPLLILESYEQLIIDDINRDIKTGNDLVLFGVGMKPFFNANIIDLFNMCDRSSEYIKMFYDKVDKEIKLWTFKRRKPINDWQKQFKKHILENANEIVKQIDPEKQITKLGDSKVLEVMAYIKLKFIYEKQSLDIKSNSIIDMYNVGYTIFIDTYISERTVCAWLNSAKDKFEYLTVNLVKIADLYDKNN